MWSPSRRGLLQRLLTVLPVSGPLGRRALAVPAGVDPARPPMDSPVGSLTGSPLLPALAEAVLPAAELGEDGVARAAADFERWAAGFVESAELDHPYLWSDDLRHGPEDPRPAWEAQLADLEREARERHSLPFAELPPAERRALVEAHLPRPLPESPGHPSQAPHVALALVARFVSTPGANDLCYGADIGRHACRGLPSVGREPTPLARSEEP